MKEAIKNYCYHCYNQYSKSKNTHILIHLLLNNFIRNKQISKDELIKHSTTT